MGSSDEVEQLEQEKRRIEETIARAKEKQKAAALQKAQLAEKRKKEINAESEKEIDLHLRFTPQKILKGTLLVLILVAVFVLGRMTTDGSATDKSSGGFFSNLFSGKSSGEAAQAPTAEVAAPAETPPAPEPAPPEETPPTTEITETPPATDTIISTYKNVATTLNKVTIDWKGNWGKITEIDYTIKNNEAGTIKADYFIMTMEGYDDFEKKIPIASTIAAGQSDSAIVLVPSGFAYNEASTGDLTNVQITLTLYDAAGKQMATFQKEFNLKPAS